MKSKFFTLLFYTFIFISTSINAQVCDCSDETSAQGSNLLSEGFEGINEGVNLTGGYWIVPSTPNFKNVGPLVISHTTYCGTRAIEFKYVSSTNTGTDVVYQLSKTIGRASFRMFVPSNKSAKLSFSSSTKNYLYSIFFGTDGKALVFNGSIDKSKAPIATFNYSQNTWMRISNFSVSTNFSIESYLFVNDINIAKFAGLTEGITKLDFTANNWADFNYPVDDLFYIDKICNTAKATIPPSCVDTKSVCLKGTKNNIAQSICEAKIAGFLNNELIYCDGNLNSNQDISSIPILKIYPNPTLETAYLDFMEKDYQKVEINVLDANSRILKTIKSNNSESIAVDLAHLPSQMYILQIKMGEKVFYEKIQKM